MAHEITATDTPIFAGRRAWHGLGTVLEDAPTIAGGLQLAGLDWQVEAWPMSATNGEVRQTIDTHVLNVRSDTRAPLGVVGSSYVPLQNPDLAGFAEQLMGAGARVESAGSIRGGKRVWFLIRTGDEIELGNTGADRVVPYVLLANGHDGTLAFHAQPTTIRVVCSNTLHAAIDRTGESAKAGRSLRVRHTSGVQWRLDDARRVLEAHGIIVKAWREKAEALTRVSLTRTETADYFETVYAAAFAEPKTSRGEARRDNVISGWKRATSQHRNTLDGIGGTAWSALNVVTDYADHRMGSDKQTADERQHRAWFGSGAELKSKAWGEALALA